MKKEKTWVKVIEYMVIYLMFLFGGFILGMAYQQRLTTIMVGEALSYTNIKVDVNFNETKLVQELNTTLIPVFKGIINQSSQLNKTGINK